MTDRSDPIPLIAIDTSDGSREVPGFFVVMIDGKPVNSSQEIAPGVPLPRQWTSFTDAGDWIEQEIPIPGPFTDKNYTPFLALQEVEGIPVVWGAMRDKHSVVIAYIGSFRYNDGRKVDPLKVGTVEEFGKTN